MPTLLKLFNQILHSEIFPSDWCKGYIIPLFKSGDRLDPSNYRGITIANCLGKLFTKILNTRLLNFIQENNIINEKQIGFMPRSRTTDHILVLKTILDIFKKQRKSLFICFVDLKKAFDTVYRKGLLYKLEKQELSSKFINLVESMYSKITSRVKSTNGLTCEFPIEIGTRQGCNLSPTLFNLYINDLSKEFDGNETDNILIDNKVINCLMYADDLVLLSKTESFMKTSLQKLEKFCNKWRLNISVEKTKILVINDQKHANHQFKIYNLKLETVSSYCYLGVVISNKGDFKLAIDKLLHKATRAFHALRQEFNFYNNTSPKVILKLFDTMIQPILLYGCELWSIFGWRQNTLYHINKYLLYGKHRFETLHTKMCRNVLGVQRKATELLVKAELGRYPLISNIIKQTYTYWQHIVGSNQSTLLHSVLKYLIENDRKGNVNYYSRIKGLFLALKSQEYIYKESNPNISRRNADLIKSKFQQMYCEFFFKTIKEKAQRPHSGGRFEIYYKVKKQYKFEEYLHLNQNTLRRHITNIRISTHSLPIESLRKLGIPRNERLCPLCPTNEIGSEFHILMNCPNPKLTELRHHLDSNLKTLYEQWEKMSKSNKFIYLLLAIDKQPTFYFAIFLEKIFKEFNSS